MNLQIESMAIDLPPVAAHPNRAPFRGMLTLVDTPSDRAPAGAEGHRVLLTRAAAERALPSLLGMALDYAPSLDRHDARRKVGIITEANVVASRLSPVASAATRMVDRVAQAFKPADRRQEGDPALAAEGHCQSQNGSTPGAKAQSLCRAAIAGLKACSTQFAAAGVSLPRAVARERLATGDCIQVAGYLYARDFPEVIRELRGQSPAGGGRATSLGMSYEMTDARIENTRAAVWVVSECTFTGAAILRRDKAAYTSTWIELV